MIEKDSNIRVNLKSNFGDTTFLYNALKAGKIDLYPEFTGTITSTFLKDPVSSTDPNVVWQKAEEGIKNLINLHICPQ